jgi:hypothetical protein
MQQDNWGHDPRPLHLVISPSLRPKSPDDLLPKERVLVVKRYGERFTGSATYMSELLGLSKTGLTIRARKALEEHQLAFEYRGYSFELKLV